MPPCITSSGMSVQEKGTAKYVLRDKYQNNMLCGLWATNSRRQQQPFACIACWKFKAETTWLCTHAQNTSATNTPTCNTPNNPHATTILPYMNAHAPTPWLNSLHVWHLMGRCWQFECKVEAYNNPPAADPTALHPVHHPINRSSPRFRLGGSQAETRWA